MAKINRSKFSSSENFTIDEIEVECEENNEDHDQFVETLRDADRVVVIVEAAGGMTVTVKQDGQEREPVKITQEGEVTRLLFHLAPDQGNVGLNFVGNLGARAKAVAIVFIKKLNDLIAGARGWLSCWACRKLVRAVLWWVLAAVGFPLPVLDDSLTDGVFDTLTEIFSTDEHPGILGEILMEFSDELKDGIRQAIEVVRGILDPLGWIALRVCRAFGVCP